MTLKKLSLLLVALCVLLGLNVPAFADFKTTITLVVGSSSGGNDDSTYTLTIPESLTVLKGGWNAFDGGISIKTNDGSTFSADKVLFISADSANGWKLVLSPDKTDSVTYTLATQENGPEVTKFTFIAASVDAGVSQDLGIMLGDYSNKTAGNYEDTITFRAVVQDPTPAGETVTLTSATGEVTLKDGDILTGTAGSEAHITIAAGATITLKDATITSIGTANEWAGITPLGNATIILEGTNSVKGGYEDYPGIFAGATGSTLTIKGNGSLTASSGGDDDSNYGAGIGGGHSASCGNIVIEGGNITATGGNSAAGIGGGYKASCGNITISGGNITATGGDYAAGIGSGYIASCGNITISGGTITATGGESGAGIGGGYKTSCGTITITSGVTSVTATKGEDAPNSIGVGDGGSCGTVTIDSGANVTQN